MILTAYTSADSTFPGSIHLILSSEEKTLASLYPTTFNVIDLQKVCVPCPHPHFFRISHSLGIKAHTSKLAFFPSLTPTHIHDSSQDTPRTPHHIYTRFPATSNVGISCLPVCVYPGMLTTPYCLTLSSFCINSLCDPP